MKQTPIVKLIEEKLKNIYSEMTVNTLCHENITDYERGKVKGKIECLSSLLRDIEKNNKD